MNSIFFLQYKNTPCSFLTVDVAKALKSWVYCSFCNASLFLLPSKPLTFRLQNFYFSFSTIFTFPCQNYYFPPSITFTFHLQKLPLFYWYQVYLQVEMFSCSSHVLSVIKINFHWSINVEIKSTASKYPDKIKKYQNILLEIITSDTVVYCMSLAIFLTIVKRLDFIPLPSLLKIGRTCENPPPGVERRILPLK